MFKVTTHVNAHDLHSPSVLSFLDDSAEVLRKAVLELWSIRHKDLQNKQSQG